ncbi:CinA family protein [Specibacter sp. NPDC057265]|uniref:CinA family protein n=1 Tax=Specibacter sp. NPDC057265 TaxID=3346075 RepID=UPI00362627B1
MAGKEPSRLVEQSLEVAAAISQAARTSGTSVAVAESLTSGSISCHLGAAEESSNWYLGAVTAYSSEVKFSVLDVQRGPVITALCAQQMAAGVGKLMGADFALAVTGVGGPGPEEGSPAGTVFIAIHHAGNSTVEEHHFHGDASHIVQATTQAALRMLEAAMRTSTAA